MAEERNVRPSEQILPGSLSDTVANNKPIPELSITEQFKIPLEDIPLDGAFTQENRDMFNAAYRANQFVLPESYSPVNTTGEDLKMDTSLSGIVNLENRPEQFKDNLKAPTFFSVDDTNYERYYTNPNFKELGFTPYTPNIETLYNKNTSWWQDIVRATPYVWDSGKSAFFSGYRTIGDFFSGETFEPDFIGGLAMSDAQRIAGSTKGGVGGFMTNLYLNSGYTMGIIVNIAAEELAILGGSAAMSATGVGLPAGIGTAVAGTARNTYRLGRALWNWMPAARMAGATYEMIKGFNNVDRARKFWSATKGVGNVAGKLFVPNTLRALKELNTSKSALQNLGKLAVGARVFGGFYRDARALNLALSESKMESALVYNEKLGSNLGALQGRDGEYSDEDFKKAQENAADAGFSTLMWNWPVIWATNNLILRTAFRGFNSAKLNRILNDTGGLHKNIKRTKPLKTASGELAKDVFEDVGSKGWKNTLGIPTMKRIKSWTAGGTTKAFGHGALRYFLFNIAEGAQEVYQEAVAVGAKDYYDQILEDPYAGDWNTLWGAMSEGAASQFTGQGFETFMSGFLMGGIVRGPQKIMFETLPALVQQRANPTDYAEYQKKKEEVVENLVKVYNEQYNKMVDTGDFQFNPHKKSNAVMRQAEDAMDKAERNEDPLGFYDSKDFIKFQQAYRIFETGGSPYFASAMGDFAKLTDEELMEAFPQQKKEIKSGKFRDRLNETVKEIQDMQDRFTLHVDKYKNKYDPNQFKKGTRDHTLELSKWAAYEHARYLYLFSEESFKRSLERTNKIYEGLATEPVFQDNSKIAANDIQVLSDTNSILSEINLLLQEIEMLKETKGDKRKEIASKKRRLKALENYVNVLEAKENKTKDGKRFSRTPGNIKKLRKVFLEYVDVLAEEKGTYTNLSNIDASLRNLIDFSDLKDRTKAYERAVRFLADPSELDRLADSMQNQFLFIFNNSIKYYKKSVQNKIAKEERAVVLQALAKLGVLPIPEEAEEFILTGDPAALKTFQSKEGVVTEESNPELYQKIQETLENYKKLYRKETEQTADTQEQTEPDFENSRIDDQQDFDKASTEGQPLPAINTDNLSDEESIILNRLYDKYVQGSTEEVLSEDEWLQLSKTKRQYNAIRKLLARYQTDIASQKKESKTDQELVVPNASWSRGTNHTYGSDKMEIMLSAKRADGESSTSNNDIDYFEVRINVLQGGQMTYNKLLSKTFKTFDEAKAYAESRAAKDAAKNKPKDYVLKETVPTFQQWFAKNRGENSIKTILALGGVSSLQPSDFLSKEVKIEPKKLPSNQKRIKAGFNKDVNLVEIKSVDQEGNEVRIYELQDNQGSIIPYGTLQRAGIEKSSYVSIREGETAFNKVVKTLDGDVKFNFDGLELQYGDRIVDDKGQQYMVLGTPKNIQDGNKLRVKVLGTNKEELLPETGFTTKYNLDTRTFKERLSPEKTTLTRIKSGELTHVYPTKENSRSIRDAVNSKDFNINNITFRIKLNPTRTERDFQINQDLKPNPFIKKRGDKYTVEVLYEGKIIGYVSNDQYRIEKDGQPLNLDKPLDALQFVFDIADKKKIEDQYLSAKALVETLDNIYETGTTEFTLADLQKDGINFSIANDRIIYDAPAKSLDQYSYNTYNGSRLIIFSRRTDKGKQIVTDYVSDIEDVGEAQNLYNTALEDLKKNTNFNIKKPGYYAVVNKPDGSVGVLSLDLKADNILMNELFDKIKDKSKDLAANNVENNKAKDKAASVDFNALLDADLFVSSKPGSYTKLFVDALGNLVFEARVDGKKQSVQLSAQEIEEGKGLSELISRMNAKSSFKFSTNNFKANISREATIDEIVSKTVSTTDFVAPPVNRQMRFFVDSEVLNDQMGIEVSQAKQQEEKPIDLGKVQELSESSETISPADQRANELNEAILERDRIKEEIYANAKAEGKNRIEALNESKEYKDAVKKVKDIQKNFGDAYKILPNDFTGVETQKIDSFIRWAEENLPEFIGIGNINEIGNRLKNNGITAGAFVMALDKLAGGVDIKGTIYVGAHGFRYHEAFHSVFRMLLTPEEQKQYLAIAEKEYRAKLRKEGKDFEQELEKFRNSSALYMSFSRDRLKQELYEEYMADEFENFKKNPRSSTAGGFIKSFFTRILNWIKTVLGTFTKNELQTLFEQIDSGKFKSSGMANNEFTNEVVLHNASAGITTDAFKILPIEERVDQFGRVSYSYLDANDASFLINSMAARTLQLNDKDAGQTLKEIEQQVYEEYLDLYDPNNKRYDDVSTEKKNKVDNIYKALSFTEGVTPSVSLAVRELIDTFQLKIDNQSEIEETFENDLGLRATDQYGLDPSTIGVALPLKLRVYMATTLLEDVDMFGNKFLVDPTYDEQGKIIDEGSRLIIPVDVDSVYNGAIKAVQNKNTAYEILSSLYMFGRTNIHTKAFVDRLFNDMGIDGEALVESGELPKLVYRSGFTMQVIKSLQNSKINYLFTQNVDGKYYFYSAATRDASRSQLNSWQSAYDLKRNRMMVDPAFKNKVQATFKKAIGRLQAERNTLDNVRFDKEATQLANDIADALGIRLSPEYLKLSMLSANPDNIKNKTRAQEQLLLDFNKVRTLTVDDLSAMKDIVLAPTPGNLYSKESGAEARIRSISVGNQMLDENIGASSFTNANGDLVYAHQQPTFHTKMMKKLNDVDFLEELAAQYPDNPLIQSEAFRQMTIEKKHEITRFAGFRKGGKVRLDEESSLVINDGTKSAEMTRDYGSQSPKEFLENLVNLYVFNHNKNISYSGQAVSPTLIRVMEAGNTGDMVALPIIKTVESVAKNKGVSIKIISGGQTGVDRIGLEEGQKLGIETGGTAPKGFKTEKGSDPTLADFGLVESDSANYLVRTEQNVINSDATVYFADNENSAGLKATQKFSNKHNKPFILNPTSSELTAFLKDNSVTTLNIAGNRQSKLTKETEATIRKTLNTSLRGLKVKSNFKITQDTLNIFYKQIQNEYDRIVKESNQDTQTEDLIDGYNTDKNGRAYKLWNTKTLLPTDVVTLLEGFAKEGKPFAEAAALSTGKINFFRVLENQLLEEFKSFSNLMNEISPQGNVNNLLAPVVKNGTQDEIIDQQYNLVFGNVQHNLAQIYFNDKINTTAINQLLLGDEAFTLKDAVDQVKRAKAQAAATRSIDIPFTDPQVGITHTLSEIQIYPFRDPTFEKRAGGPQDQTDAQVYYTAKGFRYSQFGMGNLTEAYADVIDYAERGEKAPNQFVDMYAGKQNAMNSKKFVYYDGSTYIKMSVVPLTPEFTSLKDENGMYTRPKPNKVELHNLRVKMEEYEKTNNTIVFTAPVTALKMLKKNVNEAKDAFGNNPIIQEQLTTVDAQFMGLQQVNPSNKTEATVGTQMRVLITAEQNKNEEVTINGEKQKIGDIINKYNDNVSNKIDGSFSKYETLLFPDGVENTPDLYTFLQYAQRNLKAGKYSSNIIDMFSVDDDGQMKYGTHAPFTIKDAERQLLSMFNKTVREKVPGTSAALMSDYGVKIYRKVYSLDANNVPLEQEVIREDIIHKNGTVVDLDISDGLNINELKEALKNSKDGVIVVDRLRSDMVDKDGLKYSEFVMPAMSKDIMDLIVDENISIPEFLHKVYGVRIPSQDKHSAVNLRLVDFMPHYMGSTGVFAREILERSGADFDIDKIYLHFKDMYVKDGKFFEYGKQGYQDYITYVSQSIKSSKPNPFKEAYEKFKLGSKKSAEISEQDAIKGALTQLKLPITQEEFDAYKDIETLYPAPNNNIDLDYKYALLGNKKITEAPAGQTPIIAEEAGTDRLLSARKYMEQIVPEWAEKTKDVEFNVNSLLGKFYSYKNNKEGAGNIGLAVKPNLAYSLLREQNVPIRKSGTFAINKNRATKFETKIGNDRVASIFDELVTGMTDNAKLVIAPKLGLSKKNLPIVAAGIAVGIPLNDIILFVNSPIFESPSFVEQQSPYLFADDKNFTTITTTEILKTYNEGGTAAIQNKMITIRHKLGAIAAQARNLGVLMNYMRGFGKDFGSTLYQQNQIEKLFISNPKLLPVFNFKMDRRSFISDNYYLGERFNSIAERILPRFNPAFKKAFKDQILPQLSPSVIDFNEGKGADEVALHFISYLLLTKYRDNLNNSPSKLAGTLSNSMIYGNSNGESIIDVVERLRKSDPENNNYFLNNFVQTVGFDDPQNNDGLNKAVTNTFARLTENQKLKVQNAFSMLFGNTDTRTDAVKILHYIMVKDGLQFNTGSLLQALSPYVIETFLDKTSDIVDTKTQGTLGVTEFVDNYFRSASAQKYLQQGYDSVTKPFGSKRVIDKVQHILVDAEKVTVQVANNLLVPYRLYIRVNKQLYEYVTEEGDQVLYKPIDIEGSIAQTPIGFLFNTVDYTRPKTKDIVNPMQRNQITLEEYQEMTGMNQAYAPGSNVTANENGYILEDTKGNVEKVVEGYVIPDENIEQDFEQTDLENQAPMPTSKVRDMLKASMELKDNKKLGNFWDNEINNYPERKEKTGFNSYLDLENAYKEVADDISVEEFIENSVRCKF